MVTRVKHIYEKISKKRGIPIEVIESIGDIIFDTLLNYMEKPEDLAYELPKFGTFNVRFKKFTDYYEHFINKLEKNDPEAIKNRDADPEKFERNTRLYRKIKEFKSDKEAKRKLRYETNKSSEDKSKEYKEVSSGLDSIYPI